MPRTNDDDLLALIAESDQLHRNAPPTGLDEAGRERAQALGDQIKATIPVTLAGVLALLEYTDWWKDDPATVSAVTGLRAIVGVRDDSSPAAPGRHVDDERFKIEHALAEVSGVAAVLRNLRDADELEASEELFPYLANQLDQHHDDADAALSLLFGLGEHSTLRGGPGPLVIPAAGDERKGGAK